MGVACEALGVPRVLLLTFEWEGVNGASEPAFGMVCLAADSSILVWLANNLVVIVPVFCATW